VADCPLALVFVHEIAWAEFFIDCHDFGKSEIQFLFQVQGFSVYFADMGTNQRKRLDSSLQLQPPKVPLNPAD
jgi:hypothetical protein